jgi:hypothetical protein
VISLVSVLVAVVALVLVLANATLVDRRPPSVARVSLSAAANGDGTLAQTVTSINIEFSEPVRTGTVERRLRLLPNVAGTITWDGSTAIFTPSRALPQDTAFKVLIAEGFEDLAGNAASGPVEWAFRTVGPPIVLASEPANGAVGVPVDTTLTITFDRLMDTRAVEAAITVEPATEVRATWSGQAVALAFERLDFATTYTVSVGTEAADTDGSRLRVRFSTRFSTVAAGLAVERTLPAPGVAGISTRTPIAVAFDGPIEPDSIGEALQITPAVDGSVSAVALPSDASPRPAPGAPAPAPTVLVFQPNEPLAANTTYTVALAAVVTRADVPGEVAPGRTWSFTTGQASLSGQNQIAFLSARGGVRNVWLMNPDGSNARQLTSELVPVAAFDIAPNGDALAWSAGGEIRTMRMDGADERTLTAGGFFEYAPRYTPEGRALLLARRDAAGDDLGYSIVPLDATAPPERQVLASGAPPLGSVAIEGDGVAQEAAGAWASRSAFDPTGRWLAITTGGGDVRLIDLQAAAPAAAVETGVVAPGGPAWSPADQRFYIVGRRGSDAGSRLYAIRTDGATLGSFPAGGSVAVASDGRLAVIVDVAGGRARVAVARPSDASAPPLAPSGPLADSAPAFSPDGRTILVVRTSGDGQPVPAGIWTVDPTSGRVAALTTDGAAPRWIP